MARRKRRHRSYTTEEREAALSVLHSLGGNYTKASEQTGVPKTTLQVWATPPKKNEPLPNVRAERSPAFLAAAETADANLASRIEAVLDDFMGKAVAKAELCGLKDLATAFGVFFDRLRLLRGQSTANVSGYGRDRDLDGLPAGEIVRLYRQALEAPGEGEQRPGTTPPRNADVCA